MLPDAAEDKNALIGFIMQTNKVFYLENDRPYDEWYVSQYQKWEKVVNMEE
ncbi:Hypothetical protein [Lactobacillus kefiranofaciens ZW3] [Lactiplantibacillus mudanjiangensis]|uniref:hypothetical protein n=1 Tax=Lactiplantibacillus mudanjiangensis TaxID=1296538 RepID=UPI0010153A4B|nr:Hypothetical protein [Lactobacillus kefiranofaciens ZW3] [Lactiplantibacillus mudanjiangensis]